MKALKATKTPVTLTYDDVIGKIKSVGTSKNLDLAWRECVETAATLREDTRYSRMAIAELAERAVFVRHGGDRKSIRWSYDGQKNTLKQFATECGLSLTSLYAWTLYKNRVFNHLPEKAQRDFKLSAAETVNHRLLRAGFYAQGKKSKIPPEGLVAKFYAEESVESRNSKRRHKLSYTYLSHAHSHMKKPVFLSKYSQAELEGIASFCTGILKSIHSLKTIKSVKR